MSTGSDPDVTPADARTPLRGDLMVVLAVAVGAVVGAEARYGLGLAWPHHADGFPWSTLVINVSGSFLLAVLLIVVTERRPAAPRLTRPLLGTGALGGYTTFSTFGIDAAQLTHHGRPLLALVYLIATLVLGVLAVLAGRWIARIGSVR